MLRQIRRLAVFSILLVPAGAWGQNGTLPADVAATVNGQPIPKSAIERGVNRHPPEQRDKVRGEILDFLIDNVIVDQYLGLMKITADEKEVAARLEEVKKELVKTNQSLDKLLQGLSLSEAEFLVQIAADLRWEKFALQQSTDTALKALFDAHLDMFDGSQVRARHILLSPASDDKAQAAAAAELAQIKKQVEAAAAAAVAKLPPTADALMREQERGKQIEEGFSAIAREKSVCPSKRDGGDLNWFPRAGSMVEPFAKAAFALKTFEISEPIKTQFGYHLILATGRKPGQTVKFEEVKEEVREVYCNQLREAISTKYRPAAKIVIAK